MARKKERGKRRVAIGVQTQEEREIFELWEKRIDRLLDTVPQEYNKGQM